MPPQGRPDRSPLSRSWLASGDVYDCWANSRFAASLLSCSSSSFFFAPRMHRQLPYSPRSIMVNFSALKSQSKPCVRQGHDYDLNASNTGLFCANGPFNIFRLLTRCKTLTIRSIAPYPKEPEKFGNEQLTESSLSIPHLILSLLSLLA
jgi:hypothetical protein